MSDKKNSPDLYAHLGAIDEARISLENSLGSFELALTQMETALAKTLSDWAGDARDTYQADQRRWSADAVLLHQKLKKLHALTQVIPANLRRADQKAAAQWHRR